MINKSMIPYPNRIRVSIDRGNEILRTGLVFVNLIDQNHGLVWDTVISGRVVDVELFTCQNASIDNANNCMDIDVQPIDGSSWHLILNSALRDDDLYLLWTLGRKNWQPGLLVNAIKSYNTICQPALIDKLSRITEYLSWNQQLVIQKLLNSLGCSYNLVLWDELVKAQQEMPNENLSVECLFDTVDRVVDYAMNSRLVTSNSILMQIGLWLRDDNYPFNDFNSVAKYFVYLRQGIQHLVIRRLFGLLKSGGIQKNDLKGLLSSFTNRYTTVANYRKYLQTPAMPKDISVPLLCDSLLSLQVTGGKEFLSYNGVLDRAIQELDPVHPDIELGQRGFMPRCKGQITYNNKFKGLVVFEPTKVQVQIVVEGVGANDVNKVIDAIEVESGRWQHTLKNVSGTTELTFDATLAGKVPTRADIEKRVDVMLQSHNNSSNKKQISGRSSYRECEYKLTINRSFELFPKQSGDQADPINVTKDQVIRCVENYLQNCGLKDGDVVDSIKANSLKSMFHVSSDGGFNNLLVSYGNSKFERYCTPIADQPDPLIGLPTVKCSGRDCFRPYDAPMHSHWREYDIMDMAAILGYSQVEDTDNGRQAGDAIRNFAYNLSVGSEHLGHLKCKCCGRMLYIARDTHYWYACMTPDCPERGKVIYINKCWNKCPNIIDQRESQKCPNSKYICKRCGACCSTAKFPSKTFTGHFELGQWFCPTCGKEMSSNGKQRKCPNGHVMM